MPVGASASRVAAQTVAQRTNHDAKAARRMAVVGTDRPTAEAAGRARCSARRARAAVRKHRFRSNPAETNPSTARPASRNSEAARIDPAAVATAVATATSRTVRRAIRQIPMEVCDV